MVLGDGIRRNVAHISVEERARLRDAILKIDTAKFFPDGISYFDKQEDIHKTAHIGGSDVHGGPGFIPWHRELCNRFEALLREVDSELSLHYWDWTTDPRASPDGMGGTVNLFTEDFMGNSQGDIGDPFPDFESTEGPSHIHVWRGVNSGSTSPGAPSVPSDNTILNSGNDFPVFRVAVEDAHDTSHNYIGGTITQQHYSFHDPFVFLLHSNVDRLWAMWQTQPGKEWRLDSLQVYGSDWSYLSPHNVEPWSGGDGLRPWAPPENNQVVKKYNDPSIVTPPCYDTLPTVVQVIESLNPGNAIHFNDTPESETAIRAAVFRIHSCNDITIEVKSGFGPSPPYSVFMPPSGSEVVKHVKAHPFQEGRMWFAFTGGTAGTSAPTQNIVIKCKETGQEFSFSLDGNSIVRPKAAVVLTLDQSGSMSELAGTTTSGKKIDILHEAAKQFVEVMQAQNAIGIVSFDQSAYPRFPVTEIPLTNSTSVRDPAKSAIQNLNPQGETSIGNGIELAHNTLAPVTGYDHMAIVVLTDGLENRYKFIADIDLSPFKEHTFAIGLGTENQISVAALNSITSNTGGYLLLTDQLTPDTDEYFRLSKYFLQILAGVTNTSIVTDPNGFIKPAMKIKIPFALNEADINTLVIALADIPAIRLTVETPDGDIIDPLNAAGVGASYQVGTNMLYYRFTLPVPIGAKGAHSGLWYAVLDVDGEKFKRYLSKLDNDKAAFERARSHGIRYSAGVQTFSNLRMHARLMQNSLEPGAQMTLRTVITEYALKVEGRAKVSTEVRRPDGTGGNFLLTEIEPGVFENTLTATLPGIYKYHVFANGVTMHGIPFKREQLLTGAIIRGGDRSIKPSNTDSEERDKRLCRLLECLVSKDGLGPLLSKYEIDPEIVSKCIRMFCKERAF